MEIATQKRKCVNGFDALRLPRSIEMNSNLFQIIKIREIFGILIQMRVIHSLRWQYTEYNAVDIFWHSTFEFVFLSKSFALHTFL